MLGFCAVMQNVIRNFLPLPPSSQKIYRFYRNLRIIQLKNIVFLCIILLCLHCFNWIGLESGCPDWAGAPLKSNNMRKMRMREGVS